ncbi:hypothetical protein AGMMS50262_15410 [Bacteroidia bacterium]|nr:hypothetical protein AGMMS50262_15410 [Bacteroidia bacterium]
MIATLYKGFIIGILVSAPMGPIGLLCIQRTLHKGRWHGFFSGVGAAFSDLFYAIITGIGMGIVISFIENNQHTLQIIGSILLMFYGIYIFRSNPTKNLKNTRVGKKTYYYSQDAFTAFLLTLSNPFIIFLFIALYARFNFISSDDEKIEWVIMGLGMIFAGALFWWFVITTLVGKLRKVFNVRGLLIMNRTMGVIVIFLSLLGIIYSLLG